MKNAFWKDCYRLILTTWHRFFAILIITVLGVAFFAGLRVTGTDMRSTAEAYLQQQNFMDFRLLSTIGFNAADVAAVRGAAGVKAVMPAYSCDAIAELNNNKNITVRFQSIGETQTGDNYMNRPLLDEGRMPEKSGECLADKRFARLANYKVGDTVTFNSGADKPLTDTLNTDTYTIVGIVQSPLYISVERGTGSVGSGKTDAFILVPTSEFKLSVFTELYVTVQNDGGIGRMAEGYLDLLKPVNDKLTDIGTARTEIRYEELQNEAQQKLDDAKAEVADGYQKLEDGQKKIEDAKKAYEDGAAELAKQEQTLKDGRKQYNDGVKQLTDAKAQLAQSKTQLDALDGQISALQAQLTQLPPDSQQAQALNAQLQVMTTAYAQGKAQYDAGVQEVAKNETILKATDKKLKEGEKEIAEAKIKLSDSEAELDKGAAAFESEKTDALAKLANAQKDIEKGEKDLADFKMPKWFVLDHETNAGFVGFKQDAERIDAISMVLPLIFFLVAVLVSMTSVTRLVDSDRTYIGTYKALGYSNGKIALRYLLYAVSASLIGGIAGLLIGFNLFPSVIYNAYNATLYSLPPVHIIYSLPYSVYSVLAAVLCATVPAYAICMKALRGAPAELMRPVSPHSGKRNLLERITFLWKRLNFSQKVAMRNLFRYKKRLIMTLIGVATCTALMFTGFGLQDAISTIGDKQFSVVQHFDMQVNLKKDISSQERAQLENVLNDSGDFRSKLDIYSQSLDVMKDGKMKSVILTVPESTEKLSTFISLHNRKTGEKYTLDDESVIVSEKFAEKMDIKAGDMLQLRDGDGNTYTVKAGKICENYMYHYMYMSPGLYKAVFGKDMQPNQMLCILNGLQDGSQSTLSSEILKQKAVTSLSFTTDTRATFDKIMSVLNFVVIILILSAAALVFVVLFSLTTINLEERNRELATIKVLGFFNGELAAYIYRESILLTVLGTLLGLLLGIGMQRYIIGTVEIDVMMFSRELLWQSYVYSAGLTILFASLVNLIMMRHIMKIDMVSSLKSIE